jgi:hypothetical protein
MFLRNVGRFPPDFRVLYPGRYNSSDINQFTEFRSCAFISRDSSVGIAMAYRLDVRGSIPGKGKRLSSSLQRPDGL